MREQREAGDDDLERHHRDREDREEPCQDVQVDPAHRVLVCGHDGAVTYVRAGSTT
jgi:hypothetical protein